MGMTQTSEGAERNAVRGRDRNARLRARLLVSLERFVRWERAQRQSGEPGRCKVGCLWDPDALC